MREGCETTRMPPTYYVTRMRKGSMARASMERAPGPARRRPPRIRHGLPTASSCFHGKGSTPTPRARRTPARARTPTASMLTASIRHIPPSGALHRHPVPLRNMRSGLSGAVAGDVQVGERGVVRAAEGRSEPESDQAMATDEGAAARARQARHRRSAASSRCILEYLEDVDFE
jgi:hypothetical protein